MNELVAEVPIAGPRRAVGGAVSSTAPGGSWASDSSLRASWSALSLSAAGSGDAVVPGDRAAPPDGDGSIAPDGDVNGADGPGRTVEAHAAAPIATAAALAPTATARANPLYMTPFLMLV